MLAAALLVIPFLVLEESNVDASWHAAAAVLNWGTWLAFLAELAVMLAVVRDRRAWLRKHPGIYWAVTTMTTVGYGDVTPDTHAGRAIAMAVMIVGIGFVSILIGAVAERFVAGQAAGDAEEERELLRELRDLGDRVRRIEDMLERRDG